LCETLEAKLIGQFGRPQTVRRFMEEACGRLWAEAVMITPR